MFQCPCKHSLEDLDKGFSGLLGMSQAYPQLFVYAVTHLHHCTFDLHSRTGQKQWEKDGNLDTYQLDLDLEKKHTINRQPWNLTLITLSLPNFVRHKIPIVRDGHWR